MAFTYTFDATTPANASAISGGAAVIRNTSLILTERLSNMVYGLVAGETNDALQGFKYARMMVQGSAPTYLTGGGIIYSYAVNGVNELHYIDSANSAVQLTSGGKVKMMASKARAYRATSNQSISAGAGATKVQLNEEDYDISSEYDKTTNFRFTAATTGYYLITFGINLQVATSGGSNQTCSFDIYKNGASIFYTPLFISATGYTYFAQGSIIVALTAADYVELYHTPISSTYASTIVYGATKSFLCIHRLS